MARLHAPTRRVAHAQDVVRLVVFLGNTVEHRRHLLGSLVQVGFCHQIILRCGARLALAAFRRTAGAPLPRRV
ncbi:hypothetical protein ACFPRL_33390 [Pseudoclavibacter helvolus]